MDIAGILETVNTLKNMTASIVTDDLKSAAILSWLKDAGFYQLKDAVNGAGKGKGKVSRVEVCVGGCPVIHSIGSIQPVARLTHLLFRCWLGLAIQRLVKQLAQWILTWQVPL